MKSVAQRNQSYETIPVQWLIGALTLVTLYFQTNLADPFNSPKSWILLLIASWLTGYIWKYKKIIFDNKPIKNIFFINIVFMFFSILSTIFSDFHYGAIFGETQRRNGLVSYLSLSIISIASVIFIRIFNVKKLYLITYFIGAVSVIYALMQTTGNDFIKWVNPYNSIIGTLGNPNFAAAVMAIMGVISFSTIFIGNFKVYQKVFALILSILLLFAIYKSNAKQGLLSFILGTGIFIIILLWIRSKKLGVLALIVGIFVFLLSILGMLQSGPLEKYLYKPSVSIRGYYWRAGIEMLKNHPLFGVGLDRYGSYFKEYREVKYPLTYGFEITSTNAHNTFIQFFATGGIFLGATYLILNAYVLKRAIFGIKTFTGDNRLIMASIFSAWIAFHAQSLVSIDNVGISIWGWILSGSIIGLSISSNESPNDDKKFFLKKVNVINLNRILVSGFVTLIAFLLVALLYRGESNSYKSMANYNSVDPNSKSVLIKLNQESINTPLNDPYYVLNSAINLIQLGEVANGIDATKKVFSNDSRNLDALQSLALTYESSANISEAIVNRELISNLDPWNAANYLALGKDYKSQGNSVKSKEMLDKILSFASENQIANQAKIDLAP